MSLFQMLQQVGSRSSGLLVYITTDADAGKALHSHTQLRPEPSQDTEGQPGYQYWTRTSATPVLLGSVMQANLNPY